MADIMELIAVMEADQFKKFLYWCCGDVLLTHLPEPTAQVGLRQINRAFNGWRVMDTKGMELEKALDEICREWHKWQESSSKLADFDIKGLMLATVAAMRNPDTSSRYFVCAKLRPLMDLKRQALEFMEQAN